MPLWPVSIIRNIGARLCCLVEGLNKATHIREIIEEVYGMKEKSVPAIIDKKGTFNPIYSSTVVGDKKLRRDTSSIRQMLNTLGI